MTDHEAATMAALERAYGALADEHEALLSEHAEAVRNGETATGTIVVVYDGNRYNDDPIAVYVDGKRVTAKVLTWWSDDANEDNVLALLRRQQTRWPTRCQARHGPCCTPGRQHLRCRRRRIRHPVERDDGLLALD